MRALCETRVRRVLYGKPASTTRCSGNMESRPTCAITSLLTTELKKLSFSLKLPIAATPEWVKNKLPGWPLQLIFDAVGNPHTARWAEGVRPALALSVRPALALSFYPLQLQLLVFFSLDDISGAHPLVPHFAIVASGVIILDRQVELARRQLAD